MIELLLYVLLGLILGILLGLIPGLHPNMIALLIPTIAALDVGPTNLVAFAAALAVSNTFLDFIPSMLLGAPEAGTELTVLPAHRMLLAGNGYDAVKLAVTGGFGAVIFLVVTMPLIVFLIPSTYELTKPYTYAVLIFVVLMMVLTEEENKTKALGIFCFLFAGAIGLISAQMNIDRTLVLFPMLSGLFGASMLMLSKSEKIHVPKRCGDVYVTTRQTNRAIISGSVGGVFSGMLPGVGASEIATIASVDKDEKSFLITVGAVTIANTVMALLMVWLIQKPRSGIAVVVSQLADVGFGEAALIIAVSLFAAGVSVIVTLKIAKKFVSYLGNIHYATINKTIIITIAVMTIIFTGLYGLLLLATCTALGIFANLTGVRRSLLMGVLILPTILFYLPF